MNDWLGIRDRTVLVAGAGGLGGASAAALAGLGAQVVAVDLDQERLRRLEQQVGEQGGRLESLTADLTDPESCRRVVKETADRLGSIQVFVHAIGRNHRLPILELDDSGWTDLVNLNLSTAYWTGQAAGREMCAAGYGRMIFLSSVSGLLAHAHHAPYAAAKGGLNQLVRVMAREWAGHGVTVNAVAPGYIETDLTRDYLAKPNVRQELVNLVPAGRLGTTAEVADAVSFLASDRAAFVTGHILYVDGGRVLV
jgi:NAD(P)-dependent dehydrogenase (short-subunit alcohol dehydrogenase family)